MTGDAGAFQVELLPAALEQKPVLDDLFQPYANDFSAIHPIEFGADGRFHYPPLDAYWTDPARFPFLVTVQGQLAGFVLVQQGSQISEDPTVWDIAEFFVFRAHRRRGVGTAIARAVWTRFPGAWEVRVMQSNRDALSFWSAAVRGFVEHAVEPAAFHEGTRAWWVFSFESPGAV
jgi:predicted acetyltransferase